MTKRRPAMTLKGDKGQITIRAYGKGMRIKATSFDGDAIAEIEMASHAASLVQEIYRAQVGDDMARLRLCGVCHIDDHDADRS